MPKFNKIAILGGGAFGVALAKIAAQQTNNTILWARDNYVCDYINTYHKHPAKLSNILLPKNLRATTNLADALLNTPVVIIALPMQALEQVLNQAKNFLDPEVILVSTTKGILKHSLMLPCDIIKSLFSKNISKRACYLSGPSFALELANDLPTALTLASLDRDFALSFQEGFSQKNLRLYYSRDIIGVCVGGAFKNIIAIAAGACTGLNLGHNALASLITRGLHEISRLAERMGGQPETLRGLSGLGDLVLSCTDNLSRNYSLGLLLAKNYNLNQALAQINSVVEGVNTAKSARELCAKYNLDLPISNAVYKVLYENIPVSKAIAELLDRVLKDEF